MICYKDKTWCKFNDCKNFHPEKCHRVFSEYDIKRIIEENWVYSCFVDKPDCFIENDSESCYNIDEIFKKYQIEK